MQTPTPMTVRRAATRAATLALLVTGVLVLAGGSGARARPVAHLALVKSYPVTVSGRGFRAHARVHLRLVGQETITRRPMANRNGSFTVTFPTSIDRCTGWSLTATESGRAPVILRSPAKPECAPLGTP